MNMHRKTIILLPLLLVVFFSNCILNNNDNDLPITAHVIDKTIDTNVVLQIGKVDITAYEFQKNLDKFKGRFKQSNGREADMISIKKWVSQFIDRAYLLADAYEKGYDQDEKINAMINAGKHLLAIQQSSPPSAISLANNKRDVLKKHKDNIIEHSQLKFDNYVINTLAIAIANYTYNPDRGFFKDDFKQLLEHTLATYTSSQNKQSAITVSDFFNYYNNLIIKYDIGGSGDIKQNLSSLVYSEYVYDKAVNSGLTRQPQFALNINDFKNTLIYNKYEKQLAHNQPITPAEINNAYKRKLKTFTQATDAVVSVYYFINKRTVYSFSGMMRIKGDVPDENYQGLIKAEKHITIRYNNKSLPDTLKKTIFNLPDGDIARPIRVEDRYVLIKKENSRGSRIQSLGEVKDKVIKAIEVERINKNKQIELVRLKKQYVIKNDISQITL